MDFTKLKRDEIWDMLYKAEVDPQELQKLISEQKEYQSKEEPEPDAYFGCCPDCKRAGTLYTLMKSDNLYCAVCENYWSAGSGLFTTEWITNEKEFHDAALMIAMLKQFKQVNS
jgi:hypothetical protein